MKAGGGHHTTIGEIAVQMLTKLDWFSTLFPRIPVPIQKLIENNLLAHNAAKWKNNKLNPSAAAAGGHVAPDRESRPHGGEGDMPSFGEAERMSRLVERFGLLSERYIVTIGVNTV